MKLKTVALTVAALVGIHSASAEQFAAAIFSKTNGWHHDSIPAGVAAIKELGTMHDFSVFWTEDPNRIFNEKELAKYKVVIFLSTTGDVLSPEQKTAFEKYIQGGGGFVGIHSASDTEYKWAWYTKMVGRMFHIHPVIQTATMKVEDPNFPGMDRFAKRFLFTEEWYQFDDPRTDKLHYLLSVDEKTYKPEANWGSKQGHGMGAFHPVSWYQNYDGGRAFYTALGHQSGTYSDPNFRHHLFGGIYWAATGNSFSAE